MDVDRRKRAAGILFMAAGGIFFATAAAAHQPSYYGVGAALIGVSAAFLAQAKRQKRTRCTTRSCVNIPQLRA